MAPREKRVTLSPCVVHRRTLTRNNSSPLKLNGLSVRRERLDLLGKRRPVARPCIDDYFGRAVAIRACASAPIQRAGSCALADDARLHAAGLVEAVVKIREQYTAVADGAMHWSMMPPASRPDCCAATTSPGPNHMWKRSKKWTPCSMKMPPLISGRSRIRRKEPARCSFQDRM